MRRVITILAFYFLSTVPVAAADPFSLYTDACYHVEGGDVLGFRIGILRLSDDPYVYFQQAEGGWTAPSIVKGAAAELKRGKLTFQISDGGKPFSFTGAITEKMVTGRFTGLYDDKGKPLTIRLKRESIPFRGAPDCR